MNVVIVGAGGHGRVVLEEVDHALDSALVMWVHAYTL